MQRHRILQVAIVGIAWACVPGVWVSAAGEPEKPKEQAKAAVKPKSIAEQTKKGLAYLVSQQQENGGWGQGGGWRSANQGRVEGGEVQDPPDVGNTAIAALALIRAGTRRRAESMRRMLRRQLNSSRRKLTRSRRIRRS